MKSSISLSKLSESIRDPFSLEVAEGFIECILKKETSRKISLQGDLEPNDDLSFNLFKEAKTSQITLIQAILNKIRESPDIMLEELSINSDELETLISFKDSQVEDIFINKNYLGYSDNLIKVINKIYNMTQLLGEHTGISSIFKTKDPKTQADTRIYLNTPLNKNGFSFLTEFAKKCMDREILYNMKGFDKTDSDNGKDRTVLYGHTETFLEQIEVLEEIAREHPEWIEDFGTPIHTGGSPKINSEKEWYSMAYTPINPQNGRVLMCTYNDFMDFSGLIGFGSAMCQSLSSDTREKLRKQYNRINNTNIGEQKWNDIIDQMALLVSEKSNIIAGYNSFELGDSELKLSEHDFAYFLVYEASDNFEVNFDKKFPKGSEERKIFARQFKAQTERVVSRALNKELSPIYLSAPMVSRLSNELKHYSKTNGFRVARDFDVPERLPNGFKVSVDFDK